MLEKLILAFIATIIRIFYIIIFILQQLFKFIKATLLHLQTYSFSQNYAKTKGYSKKKINRYKYLTNKHLTNNCGNWGVSQGYTKPKKRQYSTDNSSQLPSTNVNIQYAENKWHQFKVYYNQFLNFLSPFSIKFSLIKFWSEVMYNLPDDQFVLVLFRVIYLNGRIATLSQAQKINNKNLNKLYTLFSGLLELMDEDYKELPVERFVISFNIIPMKNNKNLNTIIRDIKLDQDSNKKVTWNKINNLNLPNTADFNWWGDIYLTKTNSLGQTVHHLRKKDSKLIFIVTIINDKENQVKVMSKITGLLSFKDTNIHLSDKSIFTRMITSSKNNVSYTYEYGQIILKKVDRKTKFLTGINLSKQINNNIITMDIETRHIRNEDMELVPFNISYFDGIKKYSFYLGDYNSPDLMIMDAINSLMKPKYNQHKIYFHNLSHFDAVYLIRIIAKISKDNNVYLKPQIKDDRILDLKVSFGKNYIINFRDSYLLLPSSLDKLAKSMNVSHKSLFPLFFAGTAGTLDLNYVGQCPDYVFFKKNLDINLYIKYLLNYVHVPWSLKN